MKKISLMLILLVITGVFLLAGCKQQGQEASQVNSVTQQQ